ncbi:LysR family transcriptional regulator [Acetobacter sacchari]|uniref:LysR family transcriptional regulator n=1 Tax=Acetobacter sacchari TaxID=2661687 RepID=A0ABS3M0C2_9PROT|nr:LysR family transcriptional regulator [Acetobacter sacchari]MBO1361631.1 LysR family transcriptional regulator [Acetobacter sacchari]
MSVHDLCWDDLKLFSTIAQDRTLGAAAASLGISQPTAGRRLAVLQKKMGVPLVQRVGRGYALTEDGRNVLRYVDEMSKQARILEKSYGCGPQAVVGSVRIVAPDWFISHVVIDRLFNKKSPQEFNDLELSSDISQGEIDSCQTTILIRHEPFEEVHVLQKGLVSVRYGVYASQSFAVEGKNSIFESGDMPVIGMTFEHAAPTCFGLAREFLPENPISLRFDTTEMQALACGRGLGLCILPKIVAERMNLLHVDGILIPNQKLWIGYHRDLKNLKRLRNVVDAVSSIVSRSVL